MHLNILEASQILETARSLVERMAGGSQKFTAQLDDPDAGGLDQVLPAVRSTPSSTPSTAPWNLDAPTPYARCTS